MANENDPPKIGPLGGTTTVTPAGDVRKSLWVPFELSERLRLWAFKLHRTQAELVREGVERLLSELEAQEGTADRGKERKDS